MVSFFFHRLHLPLPFLLFGFGRLVLFKALIHIALDFPQNITHGVKLSLKCLCIHAVKLFREPAEIKASGVHAITGADHISNTERFEIGSITALVMLKVKDCR